MTVAIPPIQQHDEASEREKYERVWRERDYRQWAPGETHVVDAIATLGMSHDERVVDYGCGTGRPALAFADHGLRVVAVDIAENCLDPSVASLMRKVRDVRFEIACLWDLPPSVRGDWGFCTDVLEHIPTDMVDTVLDAIRRRTPRGAYFRIDFGADAFGPKILGTPLHLTIRPPEWWAGRLRKRWRSVRRTDTHVFVCTP